MPLPLHGIFDQAQVYEASVLTRHPCQEKYVATLVFEFVNF